jgi:hypothetical protein
VPPHVVRVVAVLSHAPERMQDDDTLAQDDTLGLAAGAAGVILVGAVGGGAVEASGIGDDKGDTGGDGATGCVVMGGWQW